MNDKSLFHLRKGMYATILTLPDEQLRLQLMRMGINTGDRVFCLERLPGGTIVIKKKRQEIAIGSELAKQIGIS